MSLPRRRILRSRADFTRVRALGQAKPGRYLLLTAVPVTGPETPCQFGFITPKYVGKAHDRNLLRRRLRAIAGIHAAEWVSGRHAVVLARRRAGEATYAELEAEFLRLAGKAWLLRPPEGGPRPC